MGTGAAETRPGNGGQRQQGAGPVGGGAPIRRGTRAAWLALADLGAGWSTRQSPSLTEEDEEETVLIWAAHARSDGYKAPRGWTVFQIPSTRTVSQTPSTPRGRHLRRKPWVARAPATPEGHRLWRLCSCYRAAVAAVRIHRAPASCAPSAGLPGWTWTLDRPRQPHQVSARARRLTVHGSPPAMATATETETDPPAGRRGAPTQSAETVAGEGRRSSPWPPAAAPDEEEAHVASDGRYSPRGGRSVQEIARMPSPPHAEACPGAGEPPTAICFLWRP